MAIEFVCPACGGTLSVGDEAAGRVIRCGGCMTALRVPAPDPAARPAPPAPPGPRAAPASPFETEPAAPPPRSPRTPTEVEPLPEDEASLPTAQRVDSRRDPDDPDRPRRARRGPPPPPGRGVFFWLILLSGVGLFAVVACCGGLALLLPGPKWRPHESAKGGFKVQMPADVQPGDDRQSGVEKAAGLTLEQGERSEGALVMGRLQQFVVIYKDMPGTKERAEKKEKSDREEIDEAIEKLLRAPGALKPARDETTTVGGFPAREVLFRCDYGWYAVRVVVADTRVYALLIHGAGRLPAGDVRKFMDTFEITDPKLVAEGKRRESEEKDGKRAKDAKDGNGAEKKPKGDPAPRRPGDE